MTAIVLVFTLSSCKKDRGLNLFTKQQDIEFGLQMKEYIDTSPDFKVLDPALYPEAYEHLNRIKDEILDNAKDITNKNVFAWEVYIIEDDILNAFALPGGYMYYYTGLIKYLDNEGQLAGVLAHEMAHIEFRHSTRQMTKRYGYAMLADILLGKEQSQMATIVKDLALGLASLQFSRDFEYQADEYAVRFLKDTKYNPLGVAGFFEKLENEDARGGRIPVFLSTHPSPEDRIDKIYQHWQAHGSKSGGDFADDYQAFKNSLP